MKHVFIKHKYQLINFLVLLIGFQAIWSSADVHQWHEGEANHSEGTVTSLNDIDLSDQSIGDIGDTNNNSSVEAGDHHCCHCINCHASFLLGSHQLAVINPERLLILSSPQSHTTPWLVTHHRPPIFTLHC